MVYFEKFTRISHIGTHIDIYICIHICKLTYKYMYTHSACSIPNTVHCRPGIHKKKIFRSALVQFRGKTDRDDYYERLLFVT